ncbi:hypothetical protein CBM2623_A220014 [Cupriavidus taiwanensis]|nr:hypothetical protein CBM2608_A210012 [Cupriavidus taiwanensis]SPA27185.1 hypothetical protein CBM2623_A220014 [Cupriavidus taiwanensis]
MPLLLGLGADLLLDLGQLRQVGAFAGTQLREDAHALARVVLRLRQQPCLRAELRRDAGLEPLLAADHAVGAILLPRRERARHQLARATQGTVAHAVDVGLDRPGEIAVLVRIEQGVEIQQAVLVATAAARGLQRGVLRRDLLLVPQVARQVVGPRSAADLPERGQRGAAVALLPRPGRTGILARQLRRRQARAQAGQLRLEWRRGKAAVGQPRHQRPRPARAQCLDQAGVALQVRLQPLQARQARILVAVFGQHRHQGFRAVAAQFGGDGGIEPIDRRQIDRGVVLQPAHIAERIGIQVAERRHVARDASERALVRGGVLVPVRQQLAHRRFVGIEPDRRIGAARRGEALEPADPVELGHQRPRLRVVRAELAQARQHGIGAGHVAGLEPGGKVGHVGTQQRFGTDGLDLDIAGIPRQVAVGRLRRARVVAGGKARLHRALRRATPVDRGAGHQPEQQQGPAPARRAPRAPRLVQSEQPGRFRQQQRGTATRAPRAVAGGGSRRGLGFGLGVDLVLLVGGIVDAEDVEEGIGRADKGGAVAVVAGGRRGGGGSRGGGRCGRAGRAGWARRVRRPWKLQQRTRRRGIVGAVVPHLRLVDKVVAAKRDQVAIVERHAVVGQAPAVDEGAIGAAEILDEGDAALEVDMGMAPRQVVDLVRIAVAKAREGIVALADQVRELLHMQRLQPDVMAFRHQRQRYARRPGLRRARRQPHPERQRRPERDFIAIAEPRRLARHWRAVHARAVLAAEVGHIDHAMLGKNARMAPRQRCGQCFRVGGKRQLAAADREQRFIDADFAEFGARHRRQEYIEFLRQILRRILRHFVRRMRREFPCGSLGHFHRHFHDQCFVRSHVSSEPTARAAAAGQGG